ncbi:MAG: T9SS type A sorting domain-containing protein [Bacteroidota bacterium]
MKNNTLPIIILLLLILLGLYTSKAAEMPFVPPANDNLCNALPLTVDAGCEDTNLNTFMATDEANEPIFICAIGSASGLDTIVNNSVWYSFVAPAEPVYLQASSAIPNNDDNWQIDVYTLGGDCADLSNLTYVDCELPFVRFENSPIMLGTTFTEGETYYVRVSGGFNPFTMLQFDGIGCVSINTVLAPANDDVCDAIELAVDGSIQIFSNIGAGIQDGEFNITPPPSSLLGGADNTGWVPGTNFLDNSVWFTFTTPAGADQVDIDLLQSTILPAGNFNTQIAVYLAVDCGDFTSFEYVIGGDNSVPPGGGLLNVNTTLNLFCPVPDATYYIVVDGGTSFLFQPTYNQGNFTIAVTNVETTTLSVEALIEAPDCSGDDNGTIVLSPRGGAGEYTYEWEDENMTGSSFPNMLSVGDYSLTVTDRCGGTVSATFTVPSNKFGDVTADAGGDQAACEDEALQLNGSFTGGFPLPELRVYRNDFERFARHDLANIENFEVINEAVTVSMQALEFVGDELYGVGSDRNFYRINLSNGEPTLIDTIPVSTNLFALSYVPSADELYLLVNNEGRGEIHTINRSTGALSLVKTLDQLITGGVIDNEQNIYTTIFPDTLAVQTFAAEEFTYVGELFTNFIGFSGLEIDPTDDRLYTSGSTSIAGADVSWQSLREISKTDGTTLSTVRDFGNNAFFRAFAFEARTTPSYDINWSPASDLDDATVLNPNLENLSMSTTYSLAVTDACGTNEDEVELELLPSVETNVDLSLFEGEMYEGITLTMDTTIVLDLLTTEGCDSIVTVNISVLTDTEDLLLLADSAVRIYPNPVKDILQVNFDEALALQVIYVRDLHGRVIRRLDLVEGQEIFSLSTADLPTGQYILDLRGVKKRAIKRFVKIN